MNELLSIAFDAISFGVAILGVPILTELSISGWEFFDHRCKNKKAPACAGTQTKA